MPFFESIGPTQLAFFTAVCHAVAQVFYREAVVRMGASSAAIVVNATMCVLGVIVFSLFGGVERWEAMGLFWFVMVGLLGPFGARFLQYKAIPRIGLARNHILLQSMPAWSAAIAIVFLGEVLTLRVALGTAAIMAGSMFLVKEEQPGGRKISLAYFLFPLIAAVFLGVNPALRKFGFAYMPSASLGMSVAMGVGFFVSLLSRGIGRESEGAGWELRSVGMLVAGAGVNAAAALAYWRAVQLGDVVDVIPITRLSLLFVIVFSWIFFREKERITGRVLAGAGLALIGAIGISIAR